MVLVGGMGFGEIVFLPLYSWGFGVMVGVVRGGRGLRGGKGTWEVILGSF